MTEYSTISRDLAEFLYRERGGVLPFIGAGVSVDAGVPIAHELGTQIAAKANAEGARVDQDAGFTDVCNAVSEQLGHGRLQQIAAEIINAIELAPTPLQQLIVRAPAQVVVTTNYDKALELAAEAADLTPIVRTPHEAHALDRPGNREVLIVHLHGHVDEPEGMALPGPSLDALASNDAFKTVLRGLVIPRVVVYLGYRLPPNDEYLHAEIERLATMFEDRGPHRLLLPSAEAQARRAELERLEAFGVTVDTFDSERGYEAVNQAALLIAPANLVEGEESLALLRDVAEYYLPPTLLPEDPDRDRTQPDNRLLMAQLGFSDETTRSPADVLAARRAVVIAEPGMGKTQLLAHLASLEYERVPLVLRLSELAVELRSHDDAERVLAAAVAHARALATDVGIPTREALDQNAYTLLFDALDEVASDRRAEVIDLLSALADRYPQHVMVVTSRVNGDVLDLEIAGFEILRIPRDGEWGRRYLRHRGIPNERIEQLFSDIQTVSDLLAVPQYASLIGERLARESLEPIPSTGFALMIDGVKDAVDREAEGLGYSPGQLYGWLRLLAVSLELRGRLTASTNELTEILGPIELRTQEARERLVERALLQDIPDVAALPSNAVQEALAADALLHTTDPVEALREATTTTLAGQEVFRADLDHMIDLFYEGAPAELRPSLRDLDELRWARTTRADAPEPELEDALDALWDIYLARRVWLDTNQGREVRDARSAVQRLVRALPEVGQERRQRWVEATRSSEPTERGNAVYFLRQLGFDENTRVWLEPLVRDENSVVRRQAAAAAVEFGAAARELLPGLHAAYSEEADELAAEAIGTAIFDLTPPDEHLESVRQLATNLLGWSRISYLVAALSLDDALSVFDVTGLRSESDERHLSDVAAKVAAHEWTDEQVQKLVRILLRTRRAYYREFRERDLLEDLARRHPDAALAGTREAASEDVNWNDLSFLQRIARETLEAAAQGILEGAITTLLEIQELRNNLPEPTAATEPAPPSEPPTLAEMLEEGSLEAHARAQILRPRLESLTRQVPDLTNAQQDQLRDIVNRLWPDEPLSSVVTIKGNTGTAPAALEAALAFSSALDLPLDPERWIEIFETQAVFFWWPATEWLSRHGDGIDEERVVAAFSTFETEFRVRHALNSLPAVSDSVANAAADALIRINAVDSVYMLSEFRERGQLDVLRRIQREAQAEPIYGARRSANLPLQATLRANEGNCASCITRSRRTRGRTKTVSLGRKRLVQKYSKNWAICSSRSLE